MYDGQPLARRRLSRVQHFPHVWKCLPAYLGCTVYTPDTVALHVVHEHGENATLDQPYNRKQEPRRPQRLRKGHDWPTSTTSSRNFKQTCSPSLEALVQRKDVCVGLTYAKNDQGCRWCKTLWLQRTVDSTTCFDAALWPPCYRRHLVHRIKYNKRPCIASNATIRPEEESDVLCGQ